MVGLSEGWRESVRIGNMSFQRTGNLALVLRALRDEPGLTRTELAGKLQFDKSTISNLTAELIGAGLVKEDEVGSAGPRGGRKPVSLRLENQRICALGIEVEPDRYRAVVQDNDAVTLFSEEGALAGDDLEAGLREISGRIIRRMVEQRVAVVGVGYGLPGSVDADEGRIIRSRSLDLSDMRLSPTVAVQLPGGYSIEVPVALDNDAICCAWGELHAGRAHSPHSDLLVVLARRTEQHVGIGLGLIMGGVVQYGGKVANGEFYTSGWRGDTWSQTSLSSAELVATASVEALRRRFLEELLDNLTPVVSVLNPRSIVLAGELRERIEEVQELIARDYGDRYLGMRIPKETFRSTLHGTDEVAAGAAGMVLERLFAVPTLDRQPGEFTITWERILPVLEHLHPSPVGDR